jgi:hypothetical protein
VKGTCGASILDFTARLVAAFQWKIIWVLAVPGAAILAAACPPMESNAAVKYWSDFIDLLDDDAKALDLFKRATKVIDSVVKDGQITRDETKTIDFTNRVKAALAALKTKT